MHVVIADPPAFTPWYDHDLASALARAGAGVELVTSRFRFGELPAPDGYRRRELFYPASTRLFRRSRLRIPLKLAEHPVGMARLARSRGDVLHVQWLSVPPLDLRLLPRRRPLVFTAHDLLPRRTSSRLELWRRIFGCFEGIVVHSERGRRTLVDLGVDAAKLRVIPIAVTPRKVEHRDDGRTVLAFGVVRPYKGVEDAVEAVRRIDGAKLLVAGDPAGATVPDDPRVEWRRGFLPDEEVDRAHAEATVAVFPYRPEIDQSAALTTALGAGVPAVVYDVGGLPDPIRAFGAGRVVPAGDVDALAAAIRELLDDPPALAAARAGAERARAEMSWDASAAAHLELYRKVA